MVKIRRALISVSDKRGVVEFAKGLREFGVEIISTGGTARTLEDAGVPVKKVSQITKFPEILNGRVKTLHPLIHGALLADRSKKSHLNTLKEHGIEPIDLVVVNLYPFTETISRKGVTLAEAIEQIDIGGPSTIRSAAKNFESVGVVVQPERYDEVLTEMRRGNGSLSRETRLDLAIDAFRHTAHYDEAIYHYLARDVEEFPRLLDLSFEKIQDLRYGENPHQKAAFYREIGAPPRSLVYAQQLHGKEPSFNNILDLDAAWSLVCEFTVPAAVVIKHTNPCGVGLAGDICTAYDRAYASDPISAFGGIVALNRVVDEALAKKLASTFLEAIIASAYLEEALEILTQKKNLITMYMGEEREPIVGLKDIKRVEGGVVVQDVDRIQEDRGEMKVMTKIHPSEKQWDDLLFAWRVAKHVKSNAIVLAKDLATVGVGAGQMSRVDAAGIAFKKAGERAKNSSLASDAFFPFRDAVDLAAEAGVKAIIQPGGSIRDDKIIAAADEHKIAMVFTGRRHFKH